MASADVARPTGLSRFSLGCDISAFAITAAYIVALQWNARDLIWGLWISSFSVGYAYLLVAIAVSTLKTESWGKLLVLLGSLPLLAFFTVHFGMFHYVHSVFLNDFFPIFDDARMAENLFNTLSYTLRQYWPLVLTTFLSRFTDMPTGEKHRGIGAAFAAPYGNVIRMHFLIFVFAGLNAAGWSEWAIFPIVAFYFVPWFALLQWLRAARQRAGAMAPES